jgi:hypothetical protein
LLDQSTQGSLDYLFLPMLENVGRRFDRLDKYPWPLDPLPLCFGSN